MAVSQIEWLFCPRPWLHDSGYTPTSLCVRRCRYSNDEAGRLLIAQCRAFIDPLTYPDTPSSNLVGPAGFDLRPWDYETPEMLLKRTGVELKLARHQPHFSAFFRGTLTSN